MIFFADMTDKIVYCLAADIECIRIVFLQTVLNLTAGKIRTLAKMPYDKILITLKFMIIYTVADWTV